MLELRDFLEYKGKLLYATEDLLAFDPMFSIPLNLPLYPKPGEARSETMFVIGSEIYTARLSAATYNHSWEGYRRVEISKDGEPVIDYKTAVSDSDSSFFVGNKLCTRNDMAYVLAEGRGLRYVGSNKVYKSLDPHSYYLLLFHNWGLPSRFQPSVILPQVQKESYTKEELEPCRQEKWAGRLRHDTTDIRVSCSVVPSYGLYMKTWEETSFQFCAWQECLIRKDLIVEGQQFSFERDQ